ncbi:glutathione S-transferase domain-containing protein, partial [Rhizobium ruizarguesonis]
RSQDGRLRPYEIEERTLLAQYNLSLLIDFSLVDAVFAPVFRYFDLFETLGDSDIFEGLERVKRWRKALSERSSVKAAVGEDYPQRLMEFLEKHNSIQLRLPAAA